MGLLGFTAGTSPPLSPPPCWDRRAPRRVLAAALAFAAGALISAVSFELVEESHRAGTAFRAAAGFAAGAVLASVLDTLLFVFLERDIAVQDDEAGRRTRQPPW